MDAYLQAGLDALADPTRMAVFQSLREGPRAVNELAGMLPVSRPAVSQHLKVLKEAGLVRDHREGTRRLYRLDPDGIERLRAHFDQMWASALGSFQQAAERLDAQEKKRGATPKGRGGRSDGAGDEP